jgi:hypothetical protein
MKKFIILVLFVFSFSFVGNINIPASGKSTVDRVIFLSDIEKIEYICIAGQWYKIIYYTDGSREMYPVLVPPQD